MDQKTTGDHYSKLSGLICAKNKMLEEFSEPGSAYALKRKAHISGWGRPFFRLINWENRTGTPDKKSIF